MTLNGKNQKQVHMEYFCHTILLMSKYYIFAPIKLNKYDFWHDRKLNLNGMPETEV